MAESYRLIRKRASDTEDFIYEIYAVEVDASGKTIRWKKAVGPFKGSSVKRVQNEVAKYWLAFKWPVLEIGSSDGEQTLIETDERIAEQEGDSPEFLNRCQIALEYVKNYLGPHPAVARDEEVRAKYENLTRALEEIYDIRR